MTAAVQAQGRSGDRVSGLSLQSLGDTVRDVFTNVRGTFEMLENVVSQLRPAGSSRVERDLNGKVRLNKSGAIDWSRTSHHTNRL